MRSAIIACTLAMLPALAAGQVTGPVVHVGDTVATFSILAYDPETGEIGGAVQSRVFSVGNGVLWAEAGVGAIATQAIVDVSYGPKGLAYLRQGLSAEEVIKRVYAEDPDPRPENWTKQGRQFAVVDAKGNVAAFTGPRASEWAGDRQVRYATAQISLRGRRSSTA